MALERRGAQLSLEFPRGVRLGRVYKLLQREDPCHPAASGEQVIRYESQQSRSSRRPLPAPHAAARSGPTLPWRWRSNYIALKGAVYNRYILRPDSGVHRPPFKELGQNQSVCDCQLSC